MFVNLDKYGNTSAASVPIALAEAVNEGRVKVGDRIVIVAFGAGFTSGAVTIEWTADPARGIAGDAAETTRAIEALGRKALAVQGDASQAETADSVVKTVLEAFGKVDILVNNAGVTRDDLIMRMSIEAWREVLETNLYGAFFMIKAVTRPMLKAKGGRIINITSVSGQAGQMGQANYSSCLLYTS